MRLKAREALGVLQQLDVRQVLARENRPPGGLALATVEFEQIDQ